MRRAIFLDVDGTYVNHRGLVPPSARAAVAAVRRNGHLVFLSTGRSISEIWPEILDVGFDGVIASAGGYVEHGGEVLFHRPMPRGHVQRVTRYFDRVGVEYILECNTGLCGRSSARDRLAELLLGAARDEQEREEIQRGLGGLVESFILVDDTDREDVNKVSFLDSGVAISRIQEDLGDDFQIIPATVPTFGANSGELSMVGITKGASMAMLIEHLGIHREHTIAFGDGLNDLEMLQFAGVGVAMANGRPEVHAVADIIADHVDDDGLAKAFLQLGLTNDEAPQP